jgi:hypothetical protein
MHATEDVVDAYEATRAFLLPFDARRWLRVALVTFFVGGLGANLSTPSLSTGGGGGETATAPPPEGFLLAAAGVALLVAVVGLAFMLVRGVMDLVLLESLREEALELRRFWGRRWRQGLALFAFRATASLGGLLLVALPVGVIYLGAEGSGSALLALGVLLLVPVVLVVPAAVALVNGFTTAFVAPVMLLEDVGVVDGWRRFWPTLTGEWREFAGYAVVNFLLLVGVGAVLSLGTMLGALALAVPFTPVALVGFLVGEAAPAVGAGVVVATGVAYGLAVVVAAALLKAPLVVFVRYYALFVLGDVEEAFDLVPLTREAVRAVEE